GGGDQGRSGGRGVAVRADQTAGGVDVALGEDADRGTGMRTADGSAGAVVAHQAARDRSAHRAGRPSVDDRPIVISDQGAHDRAEGGAGDTGVADADVADYASNPE